MRAEAIINKRPQLCYGNLTATPSSDFEISIHRANAFFQASVDVSLNNAGYFFLSGKWPNHLDKVSNYRETEFMIVVNKDGNIMQIQEKDVNDFSQANTHPLNQRSLSVLLATWANEQAKKAPRNPLNLDSAWFLNFDPAFAITVQNGRCIGLSILESVKDLPNGIHVLYATKNHKTDSFSFTHLEGLPTTTKTPE